MDDDDHRWSDGGVYVVDNRVEAIGPAADLPATADRVIDAAGMIILPGLVNTHHHFYQTLTRNVPGTQDAVLFQWLVTLYPLWVRLTPGPARGQAPRAMSPARQAPEDFGPS